MPADALVEEARQLADRYAIERDLPSDRLVTLLYDLADRVEELTKPKPRARRSGGIKRTSADKRFSDMIRARDDWTCQWPGCSHVFVPPATGGLECAHCYSRRCAVCTGKSGRSHDCTRLDPENAIALCTAHHFHADSHPMEKYELFRARLGDSRFDALSAHAHARRDRNA